jgi:Spy/CpxP family protein refolding chaperone
MNISRIALACALIAGTLPALASAQQDPASTPSAAAPSVPAKGHGKFMRALRSVNLSDAQEAQVKQLRRGYVQAHPKGSTRDPLAKKQYRQALLNVLTPDQLVQFRTSMKAGKGAR